VGRITDETVDRFTLTRAANHPELVFSSQKHFDSYFEKDAQQKWMLADGGNCFICKKYEYVVVMYEQGEGAKNEGLIEVTDKVFIDGLKKSINLSGSKLLS